MKRTPNIERAVDTFLAAIGDEFRNMVMAALASPEAPKPTAKKKSSAPTKRGRKPSSSSNAGRVRDYLGRQPWATFREIVNATGVTDTQLTRVLANGYENATIQKKGTPRRQRYALALRSVAGKVAA